MKSAPVHVAAGLSDQQKRAYRIADNRTNEETEWDEELLSFELKGLDGFDLSLTGFDEREWNALLRSGPVEGEDEVPEPGPAVTQRGDLWELGAHRVLCGDATSAEDVAQVLDGQQAALCLTDPPYGVGIDYGPLCEDTPEHVRELMQHVLPICRERAPVVLLTAGHEVLWNYPRPDWLLAWVHPAGNSGCPWGFVQNNPILAYGSDPYLQNGLGRRPDTLVLATDRQGQSGHPSPKPVAVWEWLMERGSINADDLVFDPFLGAGTTIIAAEKLNRRCYGLEIEPRYCDVIRVRWEKFTGKTATLHRK